MADQDRVKAFEKRISPEKTAKASINTRAKPARNDFLDVTALIRSIQRAEGNADCFRRLQAYCNQVDCAWRSYCLEGHQPSEGEET